MNTETEDPEEESNECRDCQGTGIGYPVERSCGECGGSGRRRSVLAFDLPED